MASCGPNDRRLAFARSIRFSRRAQRYSRREGPPARKKGEDRRKGRAAPRRSPIPRGRRVACARKGLRELAGQELVFGEGELVARIEGPSRVEGLYDVRLSTARCHREALAEHGHVPNPALHSPRRRRGRPRAIPDGVRPRPRRDCRADGGPPHHGRHVRRARPPRRSRCLPHAPRRARHVPARGPPTPTIIRCTRNG